MSHDIHHILEVNKKMFVVYDMLLLLERLNIKNAGELKPEPTVTNYVERLYYSKWAKLSV